MEPAQSLCNVKAVEFAWITFPEEGEHSPAVSPSSLGVPSSVTHVTNRAEEGGNGWSDSFQGGGESPHHLSKEHSLGGKQSWQEGREGVMETSQGRVIKQTEQAPIHPSTSKRSDVRPKYPVLFHDSTFANISNICFPLCSLACHHPAPTITSSSLFKHSLMRKYCYNEPQLKPGMKMKMNTGIAGKQE